MPKPSHDATILVVHDDALLAQEIGDRLTAWGYAVVHAPGHMRGLTVLDDTSVDLVLVQAERTDLEGKEFCRLVRRRMGQGVVPSLWLIVLGPMQERYRVAQEAKEADDLLFTPVYWTELQWRIENGLRHLRALHSLRDLSRKDTVSGLFSQSGFRALLREEVNRLARKHDWFSLLILHIRGLETVRRDLGATWAKWILADWGRHLLTQLRDYDKLGEIGEQRLCLLAPEVPPSGGKALCCRIQNDFQHYCQKNLPAAGGGLHLQCQGFSISIDVPVDAHLQAAEWILDWALQPLSVGPDSWREGRLSAGGFDWSEEGI